MVNSFNCIKKLQRAFTLIELMVVVAIIGVLATISAPMYSDYIDRARAVQAIQDIGAISTQITVYSFSNEGRYPGSLAEIGMDKMLDPWGNPYQYLNLSDPDLKGKGSPRKDHNLVPINSDYDLFSMGKDGASSSPLTAQTSRDDIVRANNGRFIGRAKDY